MAENYFTFPDCIVNVVLATKLPGLIFSNQKVLEFICSKLDTHTLISIICKMTVDKSQIRCLYKLKIV